MSCKQRWLGFVPSNRFSARGARLSHHSEALSTVAKLTHAQYGSSSIPAAGTTRQKSTIVAPMAIQSTMISTSAQPGACIPKKRIDHSPLRASWTAKTVSASLTPSASRPCRQTRNAATPIMM